MHVKGLFVAGSALIAGLVLSSSAAAAPTPPPTIGVGSNPVAVAISQARSEAYVLEDGSLSIVSLLTQRRIADIGTTPGPFPQDQTAIGLVRNSTRAYIGIFPRGSMKVFDTETRKVTRIVPIGRGATAIASAFTNGRQFAYISLLTDSSVAVVRTSDNTVVKHIKVPRGPMTIRRTPGGGTLWAGSSYSGMIFVINAVTRQFNKKFPVQDAGPVQSIEFSKDGTKAYVMGLGGLEVVDVATKKELAFVPVTKLFPGVAGLNAGPIALNASGTTLLVVNSTFPDSPGAGAVAFLDLATLKVTNTLPLGTEPLDIAVDSVRGTAYVPNYLDDTLSYFPAP
jgi:DNA-binding beta-propeller fold protein YncE